MTSEEKTTRFVDGFLKDLINIYDQIESYKKMFFDVAKQRSYEQNLQVLITSSMEPSSLYSKEDIERIIQLQSELLVQNQKEESQKNQICPKDYACALEAAYEKNRQNFYEVFGTDDFKEGNCTAIPMGILMRQKK